MNTTTLIREPEARRRLGGISRSTFWRFRQDGIVPEPIIIRKKNYFVTADLDAAILRLASQPPIKAKDLTVEVNREQ